MTQAREFMTKNVITVSPDASIQEIARLLLDHSISAVPVVDALGAPIGIVSEGDLIGRTEADRDARRDWWLDLLAEGEALAPEFLTNLASQRKTARDIMTAPVVTIDEATEVAEIVDLLQTYRIKRVPVVREGRITGIVSRADILRALATQARVSVSAHQPHGHNLLYDAIARLDDQFFSKPAPPRQAPENGKDQPAFTQSSMSAADFRALVAESQHKKDQERDETRRAAAEARRKTVRELIALHIADRNWRALLQHACEAAESGETEIMLTRFPSEVCSDGGRAINVGEPGWPATLRGEPAELYWHWEHELKPRGFHLTARVLDFPDGLLGDIGLFLTWAQ